MGIRRQFSVFFMTLIMPICLQGQAKTADTSPSHYDSKFVGVWRGQLDNLPGADIVISDEGDRLAGGILFYFHVRSDRKSPYTSTPGLPEPMLRISLDNQILHLKVSHRRAHPPGTLHGAPKEFRLKLIGPDCAELVNESEGAPIVVMKRSDY